MDSAFKKGIRFVACLASDRLVLTYFFYIDYDRNYHLYSRLRRWSVIELISVIYFSTLLQRDLKNKLILYKRYQLEFSVKEYEKKFCNISSEENVKAGK